MSKKYYISFAILTIISCISIYFTVNSDNGIFAARQIDQAIEANMASLESLRKKREILLLKIQLLREHTAESDYIEELIKRNISYARGDEVVILLDNGITAER